MTGYLDQIFQVDSIVPLISGGTVTYFASFVVQNLNQSSIAPIASTVATIAGILFGFVMASVTLLASARDNVLVQNTKKTGYLPKLVKKLHSLMIWLLTVCVVFLMCLFLSDSALVIPEDIFPSEIKYITIMMNLGVFTFSVSIVKFIFIWREFLNFASNM